MGTIIGEGGKAAGKKEVMCVKGKVNLNSGKSRRVKNCTLMLVASGRCVRSYMHVRWQTGSTPSFPGPRNRTLSVISLDNIVNA